jgi:hypothetical protein
MPHISENMSEQAVSLNALYKMYVEIAIFHNTQHQAWHLTSQITTLRYFSYTGDYSVFKSVKKFTRKYKCSSDKESTLKADTFKETVLNQTTFEPLNWNCVGANINRSLIYHSKAAP